MNGSNGSNGWNGLDGRSLLIGGGLVLAGMIAVKSAPLVPLVLIGGLIWLIGNKKGWWGARHNGFNGHAGHAGPPAPASFHEWHRQAHAAQTTPPTPQTETTQTTSRPGDWPMI
ncbi:MAG TPA: hypothetical protein VFU81_12020 [Thermomicrobiales bacterium]|nr:hypothetical protein [Thermomicrobiales bacterium]